MKMKMLLDGDHLVTDQNPLRILVVGSAQVSARCSDAARTHERFLRLEAVADLNSAITRISKSAFDVVMLALDQPDAWPADTYKRFASAEGASRAPVIIMARKEDAELAMRDGLPAPFCAFDPDARTLADVRRLMVSAGIFSRVFST